MPIGGLTTGQNNEIEIDANGQVVTNWTWLGAYWASTPLETSFSFLNIASSGDILLPIKKERNVLINRVVVDHSVIGTNTSTKYWSFGLHRVSSSLNWTLLGSANSQVNAFGESIVQIDLQDILSLNSTLFYGLRLIRNSTPGNLSIAGKLIYQQIKD